MLAPVPTDVPPQEPLYQRHEAPVPKLPPDTDSVDAAGGQTAAGLADALVGVVDRMTPVPVRGAIWVPPGDAPTVSMADLAPAEVGEKRTSNVHMPAAFRLTPVQVSLVTLN